MKKSLFLIFVSIMGAAVCAASGDIISPALTIRASGGITDLILHENQVIFSTEAGTIESYDLAVNKKKIIIKLPDTKDFMGDPAPAKILSVDKSGDGLLAVTVGEHGFRNLLIIGNGQTREVISAGHEKMMITKARWLKKDLILLSLLSNDFLLFDVARKKVLKRLSVSPYTFSDFCLDESRSYAYSSDESGIIHKIDLKSMEIVRNYEGVNVDNVFQLDYKNGIIITGGMDRRVGIINTMKNSHYFIQKDFHVYSVGLNANGTIGAFTASENNDITIFSIGEKDGDMTLHGHKGLIIRMLFFDNHTLITAANDGLLMIWHLPG